MAGDEAAAGAGEVPGDEAPQAVEAPPQGEGAPAGEAEPEGQGALLLLDPRVAEGELQSLESALGRPVRVCGEGELEDGLASAAALVVPFELPTHSGLELVEAIRLRERSCDPPSPPLPIIVVSKAPTRERVLLALRAGASSFAFQPYDPDELRARLASVEDAAEGS